MGLFDRFRRNPAATPIPPTTTTCYSTPDGTQEAKLKQGKGETAARIRHSVAEQSFEADHVARALAIEADRLAADLKPEIDRIAAEIEAEAHAAAERAAAGAPNGPGDDRYEDADSLRRSEYLPREQELDALAAGPDGLPRCRLTMVRDQLVLVSPRGLINPKSPHAYKRGIYSFSVRGTSYHERAERQGDLSPGRQLRLVREPANEFDPNAIAVHAWLGRAPVGYVNKLNAKRLAPVMDAGADVVAVSLRGSRQGLTGLVPYVLAAERTLMEHLLRDTGITLDLAAGHTP